MPQNTESPSVYELITNLVETILKSNNKPITLSNVKLLRSKTFDLLLFKKPTLYDPYWLENCFDYECHFLGWIYILKHIFKQPKMADILEKSIRTITHSELDDTTINGILHLLLRLRQLARNIPSRENLHSRLSITIPKYNLHLGGFQLTTFSSVEILSEENLEGTLRGRFLLPGFELNSAIKSKASKENDTANQMYWDIREGSEKNIWDVQCQWSKTKFAKKYSWESYEGVSFVENKPFLVEAKSTICNIVEEILEVRAKQLELDEDSGLLGVRMFSMKEYMRDLKFLVVGISSNIFRFTDNVFVLNEDIRLEGIPFDAFKNYSMLMINAGICYKGLSEMITANIHKPHGIILSEFCKAVKRYLEFYHAATTNIPCHKGIIYFHNHIKRLCKHLLIVASICKVGTFKERLSMATTQKVDSVDLINLLYTKVINHPNKQVTMVLYGLLFPCLQIYFMFLNPWLFQGIIEDPYQEFFIRPNLKFLASRGRTYWTRSFTLCDSAVPNFCYEHSQKIYECGQIANLLKVCVPDAHVFRCYKALSGTQKGSLMRCCITKKQLKSLVTNMEDYQLDVISASGPLFSLKRLLEMQKDEELRFNHFLAERKVICVKRTQCERLEKLSKEKTFKRNKEISEKESMIYRLEAESILSFYKDIAESASKLNAAITRHNDSMKSLNLSDENTSDIFSPPLRYSYSNVLPLFIAMPELESVKTPKVESHTKAAPKVSTRSNKSRKSCTIKAAKSSIASTSTNIPEGKQTISMNQQKLRKLERRHQKTEKVGKSEVNKVCKEPISKGIKLAKTNKPKESTISTTSTRKQADEYKRKVLASEYGIEKPKSPRSAKKSVGVFKSQEITKVNNKEKQGSSKEDNNDNNEIVLSGVSYIKEHKFQLERIHLNRTDSYNLLKCTSSKMIAESSQNDNPLRIPLNEVQVLNFQFIQDFIMQSIQIPINIQLSLLKSQQLNHFIKEQKYLIHMDNLRNFYFLLDGGFARTLTQLLFKRIDDLDAFDDLFTQKIVNNIMSKASEDCISKVDDTKVSLSYIPIAKAALSSTTLHDVFTLDCISMTYETKWPLNILFPTKIITKYGEIFKFLIKVHRVSWILQKIYMDMKMLRKAHRVHLKLLDLSEQYKRIQLWRHLMSQFVTTFQNYVIGQVLHSSWASFRFLLIEVNDLNDLYNAHAIYMRQIHFLCFLHQKSSSVREIILNMFDAILKFYDFLRSREWKLIGSEFTHSNYFQMEMIFKNFLGLVKYFLKSCSRIAKTSYHAQFNQLIDLLDLNLFYSRQETLVDRTNPLCMFSRLI